MTTALARVLEPPAVDKIARYLHAGQLYVSTEPSVVTTILGSCVAVCVWDQRLRFGAINHFLLPHRIGGEHSAARFGTLATTEILDRLIALGARPADLRAKVFGGASMLGAEPGALTVGTKNAEVAIEILRERSIPLLATSIGGTRGRKIVFHTDTGETFLKVV